MRPVHLAFIFGFMCLCRSRAGEVSPWQIAWKPLNDAEIHQNIVGTWVTVGTFTSTNRLKSESFYETLEFTTNGCYSATRTIVSAGMNCIARCEGFWSVKDHILTYSITNSIGLKLDYNDCEPFFYPQALVVRVNERQLLLRERLDRLCWFERAPPRITGHRPPSLSADTFRFVDRSTTVEQIEERVGPPDMVIEIGPGHDLLCYYLADDTSVTIETDGGPHIFQVRHGQTNLFKQPHPSDAFSIKAPSEGDSDSTRLKAYLRTLKAGMTPQDAERDLNRGILFKSARSVLFWPIGTLLFPFRMPQV